MESHPPESPAPAVEVKDEDVVVAATDATVDQQPAASNNVASGLSKKDYETLTGVLQRLTNYKDEDGIETAKDFQRLVRKRDLPDYFNIIKEPMAFSTLRSKIIKKQYADFRGFVRDFALISHNAQVYNRPSAPVYQDAIKLRGLFQAELENLVAEGTITAEDAQLPDLGEIPDVEDSPPPGPNEEDVEDDEDEEDEDEEDDETDDDKPRRRKKVRRSSTVAKRESKADDGGKDDPESQKKRGRPPKVHTPMEARINTLLKGLRKFKNAGGDLQILPFEKLPEKKEMPEYYQEIKEPIAMDLIKRKAKRKKYLSVDQVMRDLELMFENAKSYNREDSSVYKDAVSLQKEARIIAEQEKKKPDGDFIDEDGRLPLSDILQNGEVWKVGDWIHITNPNDVTKPIVAQIYRTWQDSTGQKWINACWYYRPEQTVHRFEKFFFENEVVKTGQYRDHMIEEVVDRCFVMFYTRFFKGRPKGFPSDKEVYVCEARYNEEKFKLNKIKTWASCVPDEVREVDYEMTLFDQARKVKKVPSPIKHLLREDAKEDDPLPKPTWGAPNAPPIVGAVHKRPREQNESPPPEPTPSPPPPEPEPVRRPPVPERSRYSSQGEISMSGSSSNNAPLPSPATTQMPSQASYGQQFVNPPRPSPSPAPLTHQTSYGSHGSVSHTALPQTPLHQPQGYNGMYSNSPTPVSHAANPLHSNYSHYQNSTPAPRPVSVSHNSHQTNVYNPPRACEVYTLPDSANSAIAVDVRNQFHTDDYGKVIFYTAPPLDANPLPEEKQLLGHSLRYLADRARTKEEDKQKRKALEMEREGKAKERAKKIKLDHEKMSKSQVDEKLNALKIWTSAVAQGTDELYKQLHGDKWQDVREDDAKALALQQQQSVKAQMDLEAFQRQRAARRDVEITGFRWT